MTTNSLQASEALIQSRQAADAATADRPLSDGVTSTSIVAEGVRGRMFVPDGASDGTAVVLYFHGGGFRQGSTQVYANYTSHLARLSGLRVVSIDYRLAPEHPYPEALDDAVAAYTWVLSTVKDGTPVVLAGDSAGGGLAAALLLEIDRLDLAMPAALAMTSPWLDLRVVAPSYLENLATDLVFPRDNAIEAAAMYLAGQDPSDSRISPLLADWTRSPPVFVAASDTESLRDDARALVELLGAIEVPVEYVRYPSTAHGWWMQYPSTPESTDVVDRMSIFLTRAAEEARPKLAKEQ